MSTAKAAGIDVDHGLGVDQVAVVRALLAVQGLGRVGEEEVARLVDRAALERRAR